MSQLCGVNNSFDFSGLLRRRQDMYFDIAAEASLCLKAHHMLPDEEDPLSRLGLTAVLKLSYFGNSTTHRLAEILINGCVGGVNEILSELHAHPARDEQCLELAHRLIETEQETIALLQSFL